MQNQHNLAKSQATQNQEETPIIIKSTFDSHLMVKMYRQKYPKMNSQDSAKVEEPVPLGNVSFGPCDNKKRGFSEITQAEDSLAQIEDI